MTFQGSKIVGRFTTGRTFGTLAPHSQLLPALTDRLLAKKVTVTARPVEDDQSYVISWIAKPKRVIINKGWYNVPLGGA